MCVFETSNIPLVKKKSEGSLDFQNTDGHQRQMPSGQGLGWQSVSKDVTAE